MSTDKYLTYRGDVRAVAAVGSTLAFVTVHPEGFPTAVYRLDCEALTLAQDPLPVGGQAILATGTSLWVGGTDKRLYHLPATGGRPQARGPELAAAPVAFAPLSKERLAVAAGSQVLVLARASGEVKQTLDIGEPVTALASDPTGQWLAVGTAKGTVSMFECESAPEFKLSDSSLLHEAAVTALLFETDELRFLSAGADQKLLSTHGRGKLDPEDRGRGANHDQPITAMVAGTLDRFITGSGDTTLKSWPRAKGARPVTQGDGVGRVVSLALVEIHGKPQIAAACADNTLRFFQLDEEGKFGEATVTTYGVDAWAKNELSQGDPKRRESALRTLAGFADEISLKRIASQMKDDPDHALRLLACQLLGASKHPRAPKLLEDGLKHKDEAVRIEAFEGLRRLAGPKDLRPLTLALKTERGDIGVRAVRALEGLAGEDDQARARLIEALEARTTEIRRAALGSLENVHGEDSPEASLTALGTPHADVRRLALLRLYQRELLDDARVQLALRWRGEDQDPEVRRVAFLLSLCTRENLVQTLRERDPELDRQFVELESGAEPGSGSEETSETEPEPDETAGEGGDPAADLATNLEELGIQMPDVSQIPLAGLGALSEMLGKLMESGQFDPEHLQEMQSKMAQLGIDFGSLLGELGQGEEGFDAEGDEGEFEGEEGEEFEEEGEHEEGEDGGGEEEMEDEE
jgi:ParB family chromosome partitioning protein